VPQSYTSLYYHLVFSTKNRAETIVPEIQPRLYEYIGGLVRGEGGTLLAIGGIPDHVHLLVKLRQDRALADVLRVVKTNSSKWAHDTFPKLPGVWWQSGSGMFTVSYSLVATLAADIARQEEHHRTEPFQSEFRRLVIEEGTEFDQRYLWD
jgi:REP element-mobilizing transposase RayT